jgi:hypothetical protein
VYLLGANLIPCVEAHSRHLPCATSRAMHFPVVYSLYVSKLMSSAKLTAVRRSSGISSAFSSGALEKRKRIGDSGILAAPQPLAGEELSPLHRLA